MRVFIDDLNLIRVESSIYIYDIKLDDNTVTWHTNDGFSQFFMTEKPIRLHLDDTIKINKVSYPLEIGVVTLSKAFDKKYRYDGQLGVIYQKDKTTFRLFTPVAKAVCLVLEDETYEMNYEEPIYTITIQGNLEGKRYHYLVKLVDTFKKVKDPYAYASGKDNENYIIDFSKTLKVKRSERLINHYVDAVIYEGHIRDMSIHLDVPSKGLFEGLIEKSKQLGSSVLTYIKNLGITHLQLLPVFDFEGVDDHDKTKAYNWGYNPSQFFCVEGWFSHDPDDPYARINSFIKVVNKAHQLGLNINMDVVYNHVYEYWTYPYDDLVPGYFYRHDSTRKMTDASYCGNDIETRNYMVRKLIIDSLKHFVIHFGIDGFRFDLMGLLDIETMRQIEKKIKAIHPTIMLYGEGWNMHTEVAKQQRSNMQNQHHFPSYAHFNDTFRNTMKGELHTPNLGYAMGNLDYIERAMEAITGSHKLFTSKNQSINYIECHDNLTFYDKMLLSTGYERKTFKLYQDYANHLIAISQGVPFYHAGQEFYRSKKGIENSYNSPDEINQIIYQSKLESVKKLKEILQIRAKFDLYRQSNYDQQKTLIKREGHLLIYILEDEQNILIHYLKNRNGLEKINVDKGNLIFSSRKVIEEPNALIVDHPGVYIYHFKK
jgi:pullulanase